MGTAHSSAQPVGARAGDTHPGGTHSADTSAADNRQVGAHRADSYPVGADTAALARRLAPHLRVTERAIDRLAYAHDASHYLLVPGAVVTPKTSDEVAEVFAANRPRHIPITFRSGGTSLSGQGLTDGILLDTRRYFRQIEVLDAGARVRVQPGATIRQVNARLLRHGRKLGPDPASEIACTVGGVIANNSSGMACGTEFNTYRTLESMVIVLPSGTVIDTADESADRLLRTLEPSLYAGLAKLVKRVRANEQSVDTIRRLFAMKNTMGYGINAFLDFDRPVDVLAHLMIGSEGTLGFVASAVFSTVAILPMAATGLAIFPDLGAATAALPALVAAGFATVELLDATSLRVAQTMDDPTTELAALTVQNHAALLVELQAATEGDLLEAIEASAPLLSGLPLISPVTLTSDPVVRQELWHTRKGLYTAVAGSRPSGTTALLEDVVVPVPVLGATCEALIELFDKYGYEQSVIFGHAKDGNIHFMLNERFELPASRERYQRFTEEMVALILAKGGSLKAEHGTGRIMAPFVRRQYGDDLYAMMKQVKALCDPAGWLNPGVVLSDDANSYLDNMKTAPTVEREVDRCVECGYCEPVCPSKDITMTPRQRIVVRREMQTAEVAGDTALLAELQKDYEYDGIDTCAVDGMCQVACPVNINTGDLVRRLRAENARKLEQALWKTASTHWDGVTRLGGFALTVADVAPAPLVTAATKLGRAALGADTVPLYGAELPRGGRRRIPHEASDPVAVFFPACIGTMFGAACGGNGVTSAFLALCDRAGVSVTVPEGIASFCCGTPWKSKGYTDGYAAMANAVLPALWAASDNGRLPVVCDAASCTEGLETMLSLARRRSERGAEHSDDYVGLHVVDAVEFVHDHILSELTVTAPLPSIAVHQTCSSTQLGINDKLTAIAQAISPDAVSPIDWGCCGFAGDRGLLHPELTASATDAEAREVNSREFAAYASVNRTCELGMTRATGHEYSHLLELLERATRPAADSKSSP
ncbi:FAD-binding and (Fe-S)-binding domain-containing protein [Rathayibacter soli]|uniref:FAD-binding and (Fe-S)-binding domain-containing protein n=1 Tax=Rathayibacter soli TaxID=3144168 RepID=UPI0027E5B234|nr:FAD-binding and (Fe-S)-binding domain-containing protein [Glaciibacter superstes]